MSAGVLGYFFGSFTVALFLPVIWLVICKVVPPLRKQIGLSYGVAAGLALVTGGLSSLGGGNPEVALTASAVAAALLYWQGERAKRKAGKA